MLSSSVFLLMHLFSFCVRTYKSTGKKKCVIQIFGSLASISGLGFAISYLQLEQERERELVERKYVFSFVLFELEGAYKQTSCAKKKYYFFCFSISNPSFVLQVWPHFSFEARFLVVHKEGEF